jgi:hypothetical protein
MMETDARGLVKCRTCNTRTLPRIAETWDAGKCPCCWDLDERREVGKALLRGIAEREERDHQKAEANTGFRKAGLDEDRLEGAAGAGVCEPAERIGVADSTRLVGHR